MNYERPDVIDSDTIKVETPDGTMFVTIGEINGAPRELLISIGKAGTAVQAWADCVARVATMAMRSGISMPAIMAEISGITSDRIKQLATGVNIRSGPEGIAYAMLVYLREKQNESDLDFGDFPAE